MCLNDGRWEEMENLVLRFPLCQIQDSNSEMQDALRYWRVSLQRAKLTHSYYLTVDLPHPDFFFILADGSKSVVHSLKQCFNSGYFLGAE